MASLLASSTARISCDFSANVLSCSRDGKAVLQGAPAAAFVAGEWATPKAGTLNLVSSAAITGTGPGELGKYSGEELRWNAGRGASHTPFVTRVKNYESGLAVALEYSFPEGAAGTQHDGKAEGQQYDVLANFPAFVPSASTPKSALSWQDDFVGAHPGLTFGPSAGPSVMFDNSTADVLLLAPTNHFLSSSAARFLADGTPALIAVGATATLESLPHNFTHGYLLYSGSEGVTDTVINWGRAMRSIYPSQKVTDPTLTGLSYQTDNGAQYCFCNEGCDSKLLAVKTYLSKIGVPVTLMSFQGGWWKNKNIHTPLCAPWCVTSWVANQTKVPMGVQKFQRELDLPLQLYAPYFCDDNVYDVENGGKYPFVSADTSLPGCGNYKFKNVAPDASREFYDMFLDYGRQRGMVAFELDFMQQNYMCVPAFRKNLSAASTWMSGMAAAAAAKTPPVPIQFCMATPNDLMQSLTMPVVTNFRASNDFYYGSSYRIGVSSLLIWSLGSVPSKDTFWSTDNSGVLSSCASELHNANGCLGGCDKDGCPADHANATAVLHTMLALMSMGPVGFSDAIGQTNASLLLATCRADGTLLKPSKPLTTIDRQLLSDAAASASAASKSKSGAPRVDVAPLALALAAVGPTTLSAYSSEIPAPEGSDVWAWYVLSHGSWTGADYTVSGADLYPPVPASQRLATWRWREGGLRCVEGQAAADCDVTIIEHRAGGGAEPVLSLRSPPPAEPLSASLHVVAHACTNGWVLLGQTDKFAAVSTQRFSQLSCAAAALHVLVSGVAGETVRVLLLDPQGHARVRNVSTFPERICGGCHGSHITAQ